MKQAIVSGANGFVGAAVVKELVHHGYAVIALVHAGHQDNVLQDSAVTVVPWELNHAEALLERIPVGNYEAFYHFAWNGSAGAARADTALQLQNAQWTIECLSVAKSLVADGLSLLAVLWNMKPLLRRIPRAISQDSGIFMGAGKL